MVFATVPSGNKLKIKFEVTAPIILKWDYFTEEGDIGFHIYLKKDGKKVDLAPFERNDAHLFKDRVKSHAGTFAHMSSFSITVSVICARKNCGTDSPSLTQQSKRSQLTESSTTFKYDQLKLLF